MVLLQELEWLFSEAGKSPRGKTEPDRGADEHKKHRQKTMSNRLTCQIHSGYLRFIVYEYVYIYYISISISISVSISISISIYIYIYISLSHTYTFKIHIYIYTNCILQRFIDVHLFIPFHNIEYHCS